MLKTELFMGKKRIEWIDNAKGVAIILVILGHVLPDGLFHKIIYSFHMPLFFILSGMFLIRSTNKSSVWEFSKKKFMRLYIPYVLFGYMILLPFDFIWCNYIVALPDMNKEILGRAFGTIPALRNDWPLYGHLWFLPCLFIASIIIYGLWKRCKTPQMFYIFCFLGFIGVYEKLISYAGGGATVLISNFGYLLYKGAMMGFKEQGIIGLFGGMLSTTSVALVSVVVFSFILILIFKPKD